MVSYYSGGWPTPGGDRRKVRDLMSSRTLSAFTVQELLERAAELDTLATNAKTPAGKRTLASVASRYRLLASWRAAHGQPDPQLSPAPLIGIAE